MLALLASILMTVCYSLILVVEQMEVATAVLRLDKVAICVFKCFKLLEKNIIRLHVYVYV